MKTLVRFVLNGRETEVSTWADARLVDVLREDFGLTGAKEGCGEGECGACTVLLEGRPVLSCIMAVGAVEGRSVTTVEGLRQRPGYQLLARCFEDAGAVQCGFCTPAMLMTAYALLDESPAPDEADIRRALAGNLCRCTGYAAIVQAVRLAAEQWGEVT